MAGTSKTSLAVRRLMEREDSVLARYVDIAVRWLAPSGRRLLYVGGKFDTRERVFTAARPEKAITIQLNENQVEPTLVFIDWLQRHIIYRRAIADGMRPGPARLVGWPHDDRLATLHFYGGGRVGKTIHGVFCLLAYVLAIPGVRACVVSPDLKRNAEMRDAIHKFCPQDWRKWSTDTRTYTLITGSRIEMHTATGADLKIGPVDFSFVNETQECKRQPVADIRMRTSDQAGLCILTYNPPRTASALWLQEQWEKIEAGEFTDERTFYFDIMKNRYIDVHALKAHIAKLDPLQARREGKGDMVAPVHDVVFPQFDVRKHRLQWIPTTWTDITESVTRSRCNHTARYAVGVDFDLGAGCSHVVGKVYAEGPADNLANWRLILLGGRRERDYQEHQLHDRLMAMTNHRGTTILKAPRDAALVADRSGEFQDTKHRGRREAATSWAKLQVKGWWIVGPDPDESHRKNPEVDKRLNLARRLIREGRFYVMESATELVAALRTYPTMKGTTEPKRKSKHAHLCDSATYLAYRLFADEPGQGDTSTITSVPRRSNSF